MRNFICIAAVLVSATPVLAQGMDRTDRNLGVELNRDRSENRIERLHEDKQRDDKARAEAERKRQVPQKRRPAVEPKRPAPE